MINFVLKFLAWKEEPPAQSSYGPNAKKSTPTPPIEQQPNQSTDQHKSRSDRLFLRKRIPTKDLKGIKQIKVSIEDDDDFIVDLTSPHFRKRKPYIQIFKEDVLSKPNYYKVPFGKLTMKQKRLRMKDLSKKILSACIDRQSYRQDSDQYIQGNEELAVDLISLLDGMKEFLQSKIKLNLNQYSGTPMRHIPNDSEGSILDLDSNKKIHQLAQILLCETSNSAYTRINSQFTNLSQGKESLPSAYVLDKQRGATVLPVTYQVSKTQSDQSYLVPLSSTINNNVPTSDTDELERALVTTSRPQELSGAVIKGGYRNHIDLLVNHHKKKDRIISSEDSVVVIDSFDGAEHLRSKKKITSVISFSSSLATGSWINDKLVTAGSSLDILTWQQLNGTESLSTIIPSVKEYY